MLKLKRIAAAATLAAAAAFSPAQAQISGDVIKIGIITDVSGLYSDIDGMGGVEAMKSFFFSAATFAIARLVPELVPPISMSRPWVSNHSRALAAATSGLF